MEKIFEEVLDVAGKGLVAVRDDSRQVGQGDIFVAIPGVNSNGEMFIGSALEAGAGYIVCRREALESIPEQYRDRVVCHPDPREALWRLAAKRYGTDKSRLKILAVTGTNGKTTSAFLLEHLFTSAGCRVGVLGTISYHWPGYSQQAPLTTPGPLQLHSMLASMASAGVDVVVMEISSHALEQQRVCGMDISGAIFTNLTQDHLDFHKDMESYFQAKAKLFTELPKADKAMAINADDSYGLRLCEMLPHALPFGLELNMPGRTCLKGQILAQTTAGLQLKMEFGQQQWQLHSVLTGAFNAYNLLGVQALGLGLGMEPRQFACLENFRGVCGRLERVENSRGLHIFVDYAHTPDALENALKALRGAGFKRIVTVFGCGGNRDRGKRPLMGQAVAKYSDVVILTSDNPRHEDPEAIMRDVLPGLANAADVHMEVDRKKATALGVELLGAEDALLIAGKGHENYQILGDKRIHYSDQEVVRELLS